MATASETLNIRVRPAARDLIDRAAKAVGKNRSEFIVAAARGEAEAVLLDQRLFTLEGKAFAAFKAALDRPPTENPALRRLLETPAPWDRMTAPRPLAPVSGDDSRKFDVSRSRQSSIRIRRHGPSSAA